MSAHWHVGFKSLAVYDQALQVALPAWVMYPTEQKPQPVLQGPYDLTVAAEASLAKGTFPLVVISHGSGGSPFAYRTMSQYLASQGFVVAMLEHFGNNRHQNELSGTQQNLEYRPRHISLLIDAVSEDPLLSSQTNAQEAAVIGHSMGGYTALCLAGAKPYGLDRQPIAVQKDERVKKIVLLAPGTGWFQAPDSWEDVDVPIFVYAAEYDNVTPSVQSEYILKSVKNPLLVTYQLIENANHFSFLSVFPQSMTSPQFLPSTDRPGFDRAQFQETLKVEVARFLSFVPNKKKSASD